MTMSKASERLADLSEDIAQGFKSTQRLFARLARVVAPPPTLTVSEWADEYRILSKESSAEAGRWRTSRTPYQREIMDCVTDRNTKEVVVMASAQVGKSEMINNIIGYYIDYNAAPILLLMPTLEIAQAYSKDRIAPMIRDSKTLASKVGDPAARDGDNTLLHKKFPGGHLTLVGANSPAGLASRPIKIVLADEVDRFPASAGSEGDPLFLAHQRTKTFWDAKKISVSTPTEEKTSRIYKEFQDSTKEEWYIACPSCGFFQPYVWGQITFEPVGMKCADCGEVHTEQEWKSRPGEWIVTGDEKSSRRGFHLNALMSPWESWDNIIANFKKAKKSQETLKAWVNTTLGEVWVEDYEAQDVEPLLKRRIEYKADLPEGVLILTAGVDVQDDRLEIEVVGWGHNDQSYGISYQIFMGDPGREEVWEALDHYLQKSFEFEDGVQLSISCACVDSGGHYTQEVYEFCKAREHRRVYAIKGRGGEGVPFVGRHTRNNRQRAALFSIGVDAGKEMVVNRLKVVDNEAYGYCFYPANEERNYDETYFKGITSEQRKIKYVNGQPKVIWVKKSGVRNEPLDLRNYATAALKIVNPQFDLLENLRQSGQTAVAAGPRRRRKKRKQVSRGL